MKTMSLFDSLPLLAIEYQSVSFFRDAFNLYIKHLLTINTVLELWKQDGFIIDCHTLLLMVYFLSQNDFFIKANSFET